MPFLRTLSRACRSLALLLASAACFAAANPFAAAPLLAADAPAAANEPTAPPLPRIRVSDDKKGFVQGPARPREGAQTSPKAAESKLRIWGFNYDHDSSGRLLEDYWDEEWPLVEKHFGQMKKLGANVVRVHLQLGKFMESAEKPNTGALAKFEELLKLAEKEGLYLDVTGLGCYHKKDVPAWYDVLDEAGRWKVQAAFWSAVAEVGAKSTAVFCYDLMNEPIVPGGKGKDADWLGPAFGGKHFVQRITLDPAGRTRPEIAKTWIETLAAAVRAKDREALVTVGLVDWSLDRPGLSSGFVPEKVCEKLDFVCVHLYPQTGKREEDLKTLVAFDVGKPVVIEETFPLKCSMKEFEQFLDDSATRSAGCIGFYWGKPPAELAGSKEFGEVVTAAWLELFQKRAATLGLPPAAERKP